MGGTISWATMGEARPSAAAGRSQVLAWALWDFGATGLNAIVVTFVFSIYLTHTVGEDLPGGHQPDQLARVGARRRRPAGRAPGSGDRGVGRPAVAAADGHWPYSLHRWCY